MKEDMKEAGLRRSGDGCAETASGENTTGVDQGLPSGESPASESRPEPSSGKDSAAAISEGTTDGTDGGDSHGRPKEKEKPGRRKKGNSAGRRAKNGKIDAEKEAGESTGKNGTLQDVGKKDERDAADEETGFVWKPFGLGGMIGYGILISLPVIGLITAIVLAVHFRYDPIRSNFALACLVLRIFYMVMSFLIVLGIVEIFYALASSLGY